MITIEYNNGRIEVNYQVKDKRVVMTVDEAIAQINQNGELVDRVGFCVPYSAYAEVNEQAKRIDKAIESRRARRRV
jgi:hypothetical protein